MKKEITSIIKKFKENDCSQAITLFKKINNLKIPDQFTNDDNVIFVLSVINKINADKKLNQVYESTLNNDIKCFFNETMVKYNKFNSREKKCTENKKQKL